MANECKIGRISRARCHGWAVKNLTREPDWQRRVKQKQSIKEQMANLNDRVNNQASRNDGQNLNQCQTQKSGVRHWLNSRSGNLVNIGGGLSDGNNVIVTWREIGRHRESEQCRKWSNVYVLKWKIIHVRTDSRRQKVKDRQKRGLDAGRKWIHLSSKDAADVQKLLRMMYRPSFMISG